MSEQHYDLVIIGGGTAGYVAAIRAAKLNKKVAIVEKSKLGGTCLHRGCIPTKALLKSAKVLDTIKHASDFGIDTEAYSINYANILNRKESIVNQMYQGVQHLIKQNKIDFYNGVGRLLGASIFSPQSGTVSVEYENGESELLPNHQVLIATGSKPTALPFLPFDHDKVLSSDDILNMTELPQSIAIIGGGVIGVEFASLLNDFGVDVTLIEASQTILPRESKKIVRSLKQSFTKRGITIHEQASLDASSIEMTSQGVNLTLNDTTINVEKVLVAVGRTPLTEDLGLNNTKVVLDERGYIQVNEFQQTADAHIYAAGDCIGKLQLAHVGSKEGAIAVEHMFDARPIPINYDHMPKCIYAQPEIASIGPSLHDLNQESNDYQSVFVPFQSNGKAVIESLNAKDGQCEVVIHKETKEIVSVHMVGPAVTELINEVALLQFMNGSALELGLTTHAHPSISEVLMEIGLKIENRAIHV